MILQVVHESYSSRLSGISSGSTQWADSFGVGKGLTHNPQSTLLGYKSLGFGPKP
jgi:hypothetical protein